MNELSTFFQFASAALDLLPKLIEVGNKVDEMTKQHEWDMKMKYSEQEYLQTVLALFKSGKISSEEAKKTLSLIFRDEPITVNSIKKSTDIESEIYRLIGR